MCTRGDQWPTRSHTSGPIAERGDAAHPPEVGRGAEHVAARDDRRGRLSSPGRPPSPAGTSVRCAAGRPEHAGPTTTRAARAPTGAPTLSSTRRAVRSGPVPSETAGFSDLRARFVLCDESGRYRRSRALTGPAVRFLSAAEGSLAPPGPACAPPASGDVPYHEPCAYLGRIGTGRGRRRPVGDEAAGRSARTGSPAVDWTRALTSR